MEDSGNVKSCSALNHVREESCLSAGHRGCWAWPSMGSLHLSSRNRGEFQLFGLPLESSFQTKGVMP